MDLHTKQVSLAFAEFFLKYKCLHFLEAEVGLFTFDYSF